ncbi:hypothetical protein GF376_04300, partial [Candidatus Peregrinibacteria bacterium]|nr:hypothetical protein [Candidatus Peregrinibacteria bacterium]
MDNRISRIYIPLHETSFDEVMQKLTYISPEYYHFESNKMDTFPMPAEEWEQPRFEKYAGEDALISRIVTEVGLLEIIRTKKCLIFKLAGKISAINEVDSTAQKSFDMLNREYRSKLNIDRFKKRINKVARYTAIFGLSALALCDIKQPETQANEHDRQVDLNGIVDPSMQRKVTSDTPDLTKEEKKLSPEEQRLEYMIEIVKEKSPTLKKYLDGPVEFQGKRGLGYQFFSDMLSAMRELNPSSYAKQREILKLQEGFNKGSGLNARVQYAGKTEKELRMLEWGETEVRKSYQGRNSIGKLATIKRTIKDFEHLQPLSEDEKTDSEVHDKLFLYNDFEEHTRLIGPDYQVHLRNPHDVRPGEKVDYRSTEL